MPKTGLPGELKIWRYIFGDEELSKDFRVLCDCVSGRLLRAYNIEFNWFKLSSWINITEQWPYRLSWIILEVEDNPDIEDPLSLKTVYDRSAVFLCLPRYVPTVQQNVSFSKLCNSCM